MTGDVSPVAMLWPRSQIGCTDHDSQALQMFDDIIRCEISEIHMNKLKLEFCGFLSDPTYSELTLADLTNDAKK